ncbi:MAG: biopolymer transporter ExbD [Polyangiales bacterium]
MAGGARGGDDDDLITDINVTPLVDVVLVLLIILMVTATAIVSKTIQVELPEARTGEQQTQPTTLAVSIDSNAKVFLDATEVTLPQLLERAKAARAQDPETRAIIAADGRIPHANVVQVIDILRQANVLKFAINVRPSEVSGGASTMAPAGR